MKNLILFMMGLSFSAHADQRIGRFYGLDAKPEGKPIFIQRIERRTDDKGLMTSKSTIEDSDGKVVMREHAEVQGDRIISQRMDQLQIGESYELSVEGETAVFKTFKITGDDRKLVSENRVKIDGPLVTGPATERFLEPRLTKSGQSVEAPFGIFELEKGVGFRFEHRGEIEEGRKIVVGMRPASLWLKVFVSDIRMEFDKATFRMTNYRGRTPVRQLIKGKWKPLDAQIIYESQTTSQAAVD